MLGIDDPFVWLAYVLSLGSTLLCAVWGVINWNRGDDSVAAEDVQWAAREAQQES
jgi:heme exporter protein D